MQVKDMLKYRDRIIKAFRDGTFLYEHLKKSDDAAYDFALKDIGTFIKKIESMAENINLSLLREFFQWSPDDYTKYLINL